MGTRTASVKSVGSTALILPLKIHSQTLRKMVARPLVLCGPSGVGKSTIVERLKMVISLKQQNSLEICMEQANLQWKQLVSVEKSASLILICKELNKSKTPI